MAILPSRYEPDRPQFSKLKGPLECYYINQTAGTGNTSSATPSDYPGPITKNIIKRETSTSLLVSGSIGAFKGTNVGGAFFQLRINGVDIPIAQFFFNDLNSHRAVPFTVPIAQNLVAGAYTVTVRWSTTSASLNANSDDVVQIKFDEGYWA